MKSFFHELSRKLEEYIVHIDISAFFINFGLMIIFGVVNLAVAFEKGEGADIFVLVPGLNDGFLNVVLMFGEMIVVL